MSTVDRPTPGPEESSGPATSDSPARVLSGFDATCVVIGAIIGVGIFFNPSGVVRLTGTGQLALLAWAIGGLIALCGALTFAALGRRSHASGAQYEILRDAYGPLPGFLFVFCNATVIQPGAIAIISLICAQHLIFALTGAQAHTGPAFATAVVLIVLLAGANIVGVRWGSRIQNLTVICKILTLLAVAAAAAFFSKGVPWTDIRPPVEAPMNEPTRALVGVMAALVPAFFAYGGWQHALWIAGEVRQPRRNLPRAILGGVAIVVVVYLLANWAYLHLLGVPGVAESRALAAEAVSTVLPGSGARLVAAAVGVSAFGVLNAQFLSGPRLLYGMAADGRFFAPFARLHPRFRTPTASIFLLGGAGLVLLAAAGMQRQAVETLVNGVVAVDGVFFGLTGAAVFVLARRSGAGTAEQRQRAAALRSLGYPFIPLLFVLGEIGIVAGSLLNESNRSAALIGLAWIALAGVLYAGRFRKNAAA
ncbi:MAG: amino acid permease [Phycisphaerales bacterium]|nr:amino acid permease [Phycisphaerales bacterium]